eukprot:1387564-Amorphochlora_amoeboformis.AAC.3
MMCSYAYQRLQLPLRGLQREHLDWRLILDFALHLRMKGIFRGGIWNTLFVAAPRCIHKRVGRP